ncbi:MAG: glutathione peroxidase [Deltaproteobacteria bacterium]|nr:glutathione peroxidase [Deltaproteobacteria bacterium]
MSSTIYDFTAQTLHGQDTPMSAYRGKVLLIVNTASKCGFTPQYKDLQALYEAHRDEGLEILGFPCNQFGRQEPGSADDIEQFCKVNYGVTFPMHAKVDVNGKDAHPLFVFLKKEAPGILGSEAIKWNFTKFLVNREGQVLKRYAPKDTPADIDGDIVAALRA